MIKIFAYSSSLFCTGLICACGTTKTTHTESAPNLPPAQIIEAPPQPRIGGKPALRRAIIYRTNGNYSDNVAVTLNPDGTLLYYPAPTDVTSDSAPLHLVDGWLLDRQGGVSDNTTFLRWTYSQYHAFDRVPSIQEIKNSIISGARIKDIKILNMSTYDAQRDTVAVNKLILNDFLP